MGDHETLESPGIINAFLNAYFEDRDQGKVRPLESYQREFPGFEELVAREYQRLEGEPALPPVDSTADEPQQVTLDVPKERIGPYTLLTVLGQGGMGIVYLAEQSEPIHRRVALKLIKLGMDTREVLARFESERQALALMSHGNIAQVHDAGTSSDGRPYFVMEHVAGIPIVTYCDRHGLGVRERLKLYIAVCNGVQHAHQKGIIHRDLKPSNVLVAIDGDRAVPKIIDFGVAKSLSQPLTERTVYTQQGQMIGTPEYMSPEQADLNALDIDTRTDIYS
ncbi:MAG: serine/threonine protein kinase, partial [Planctomycetes bacterium]|nr:serine/threonine protein kinase [Planctomycetota bacterium]